MRRKIGQRMDRNKRRMLRRNRKDPRVRGTFRGAMPEYRCSSPLRVRAGEREASVGKAPGQFQFDNCRASWYMAGQCAVSTREV